MHGVWRDTRQVGPDGACTEKQNHQDGGWEYPGRLGSLP